MNLLGEQTLGSVFDRSGGRTSGFDYLRIGLALAVILWHTSIVSYGPESDGQLHNTPLGTISRMLLPMFFSLSGFLVAGSLFRSGSLMVYASHRVLRIFPALVVEITLSAVIMGAAVTTYSLYDYYTEGEFYRYLLNAAGHIYMFLPGVFEDHPIRWVNISLWTVPYELECYLALLCAAYFGFTRSKHVFLIFLIAAQVALPLLEFWSSDSFDIVNRIFPRALVLCFLFGVGIYMYRDSIIFSPALALLCLVLTYMIAGNTVYSYLIAAPVSYLTIFIGLINIKRIPVIFDGDYSYGMYLYAFPFQQLQVHFFPNHHEWWQNILLSLPMIVIFSIFSWHFIEKPILTRRRMIVYWLETKVEVLRRSLRFRV